MYDFVIITLVELCLQYSNISSKPPVKMNEECKIIKNALRKCMYPQVVQCYFM
jgi:hypothetical protein